ncbi:MAG: radical SAM protein [Treponema sp.]|jgi:DNA repair photolyase|nr:radical SAM protein [Treponema sp.]
MIVREIEARSLVTKTRVPAADYCINPYIGCPHRCVYCYAEFMKRFTGHSEPWGEFVDVKHCAKKINAAVYAGRSVVFSTTTDAYNPLEKQYGVTREALSAFAGSKVRVSVLTKSDLVLRDIDILKKCADAEVGFSMATVDDAFRKKIEPGAPSIAKRVNALRVLREEGIKCHVFVSPIFPEITDYKAIIDMCAPYTSEFHFENLNLRGSFRPRVLDLVARVDRRLLPFYDDIYRLRIGVYWDALEKEIIACCAERGLKCVSYFYHERIRK